MNKDGKEVIFAGTTDTSDEVKPDSKAKPTSKPDDLQTQIKELKEFSNILAMMTMFLIIMAGRPSFDEILPNKQLQERFKELQIKYFLRG